MMSPLKCLISALVGFGGLPACTPSNTSPETPLAVSQSSIRNGTRQPEALPLSEGQILSLGWLFPTGDPGQNFCTATLISPHAVITASHCTSGNGPRDISFGIGLQPSDPDATFRFESIFEHPELDLAVLLLVEDATARVPELVPIPFNASPLGAEHEDLEVQVGGYGETYDAQRYGRYFATVLLAEVTRDEIVVDGRQRQGLCYGDSGGPVFLDLGDGPVVAGVESYGDDSCFGIDHLTRVDLAAEFIAPISRGESPPDLCMGVDYLGHCIGSISEWCENGALRQLDCNDDGQRCAYVDDETGFYCVQGEACGEVTRAGACEGELLVRCRGDERVYDDCAQRGLTCRNVEGGARCTSSTLPEPDSGATPEADAGATPEADAGVGPADATTADAAPADVNQADGALGVVDGSPESSERRSGAGDCASTTSRSSGAVPLSLLVAAMLLRRRRR